jgi:hypothetical protein
MRDFIDYSNDAVPREYGSFELIGRGLYCCLTATGALAIAGCQFFGDNPPQSSANGSPFSPAATNNRNNNPSEMGLTLVDSSHNKSSSSSNSSSALPPPCLSGQATPPGPAYPPPGPMYGPPVSNYAPGGPVPGQGAPAPSGYWVYQPANGYGVTKVVPVYGPQQGELPPGIGQPIAGGTMPPGPVQPSGYPANAAAGYPAMSPNYNPGSVPFVGSSPVPPYAALQAAVPQGYGMPGPVYPQGNIAPSYAPGGMAVGAAPPPGAQPTFYPGEAGTPAGAAPPSYGGVPYQPSPNLVPQAAVPSAMPR